MSLRTPGRTLAAVVVVWLLSQGVVPAQPAPEPAPVQADYGEALLRDWIQPEYPATARKAKLEGRVEVEFVVGLDGRVSQAEVRDSTGEVFNDAALAAVRRWTFSPALEEAKPAPSALTVPIVFRLAQLKQKKAPLMPPDELLPRPVKLTRAKIKSAPDPEYPEELEDQKIPGEVQIEFTVDESGTVRAPRVLWASHAAFVEMSLRALEKTQFEPARQGPLPKSAKMQYPVEFASLGAKRAEILEANHITLTGETTAGVLPIPFVLVDPVYPIEHLLAGEGGTAVGEFTVDLNGRTKEVTVISATAPEYGASLRAAMDTWSFKPAVGNGAFVPVRLRVTHEFTPPASGPVARLAEAVRPGGGGVGPPTGLDEKLKPLWRGFPVYPAVLHDEQIKGSAEIEFIIDRAGRARLPRVKSASRDEFGWAAATAINQWVFERPRRKGEPVDVTVAIPVSFVPPKQ
jgi:TonB family protein